MEQGELEQGQFEQVENDDQQQSSQFIKTTKSGRKNLCDVCTKSLAKYTCPKCDTKSCTLACINKHKNNKGCDGRANPAEYVEKGKIDEDVVRKDFEFVKSMLQETDKVKKTLTGVTISTQEPKRFYYLKKHARQEYDTRVHLGPAMLQRHRDNISFFYMKTKTIYWVIDVLYYKGNKKYTRHLLEPQQDSKLIEEILPKDFLCQELLLKEINTQRVAQFDIFIENKEVGGESKQAQGGPKRIVQLSKETKLCDALRGLNVYEFPTLILVHKNLRKSFMKWKKIA